MPDDGKVCSFDCLYCEAGYNAQGTGSTGLPPRETVAQSLENRLNAMRLAGDPLLYRSHRTDTAIPQPAPR